MNRNDPLTYEYCGDGWYQTFWDWSISTSDEKVRKLRKEGVTSAFGSICPRYVGERIEQADN